VGRSVVVLGFRVPMPVLFVIVGLAIVAIISLFSGKCPQCGRYHSFEKTGMTRRERGTIFGTTYDEQQCIHCGYTDWVEQSSYHSGDGGGGG
jgi:predicted nucleic-acid-binding Zn-ribbon protein